MKRFIVLFLAVAIPAAANEIPRPDPRTLLQQPPMPSLQKDTNPDPPKKTIKQRLFDKKAIFLTAANVGTSIWATLAIRKCRADHGKGPCADGGYGPFGWREGLRQTQTGGLAILSLKIKSIEDADGDKHKFWSTLQAGNIGWNLGVIAENANRRFGPKREKD